MYKQYQTTSVRMLHAMKDSVHPCGSSQLVSVSLKSRISMEKDRQNPTPRLCSVAKVVPQNALLLHSTLKAQCVCKCQSINVKYNK